MTPTQLAQEIIALFIFFLSLRWSAVVELTHLNAKPNSDGKEDDYQDGRQYDQDPANAP